VLLLYSVVVIVKMFIFVVKVKLSLCLTKYHVMKAYLGSGGTSPLIL
jgi:hypothetical protein